MRVCEQTGWPISAKKNKNVAPIMLSYLFYFIRTSGQTTTVTKTMADSFTPASSNARIAIFELPPVASMGSQSKTLKHEENFEPISNAGVKGDTKKSCKTTAGKKHHATLSEGEAVCRVSLYSTARGRNASIPLSTARRTYQIDHG